MGRIIEALIALQDETGWLPADRLASLAAELRVPLHRLESLSTFYTHFHREPPPRVTVQVCRDFSCRLAGAREAQAKLDDWAAAQQGVVIEAVSCLGRCDAAPAASCRGRLLRADDCAAVASAAKAESVRPDSAAGGAREARVWPSVDPYAVGDLAPWSVLRDVLAGNPAHVVEALEAAGLRGMGGAGFPTGRKWSLVASEVARPKHVVCNADESEPGTFKDREILHDLPHLVIEGMLVAGRCVGAERGTIFLRHEYGPERARLEAALAKARAGGVLGRGIFGSDFDFEIELFVSPGGYVLGEETALLECLEDRRGEPRNKPPFPGRHGLEGRPTLINNVETLVHAVGIAHHGAAWWQALGRDGFSGHKFVSTSGDVAHPGVELFEVGTPLSEVLERHGGVLDAQALLAVAPGGASSPILGPEALAVPLDFEALRAAGSMLGSGAVVFVAEGGDLFDLGLSITRFFRNESCGKCVPCRVGTEKAVAMLEKAGRVDTNDEMLLRELHETLAQTSICGLGQVALAPLLSLLDRFPEALRGASAAPGGGNS